MCRPTAFSPSWSAISTRERPPPQTARTSRTPRPARATPLSAPVAPPNTTTRPSQRRARIAPVQPVPQPTPQSPTPPPPIPAPAAAPSQSRPRRQKSKLSSTPSPPPAQTPSPSPAPAPPLPSSSTSTSPSSSAPTEDEKAFINAQIEKRLREREAAAAGASSSATTSATPTNAASATATRAKPRGRKKRSRITKTRASSADPTARPASSSANSTASSTRQSSRKTKKTTSSTQGLKDNFQAYMDEISRDELLGQAQIITLSKRIRGGLVVETMQAKLQRKLGRRPSLPEVAKELNVEISEAQRLRMDGMAAKNALVAANLRLVTSVARKVSKSKNREATGLAFDDMVQEGSVGLIRAAEKFDASRGYRFSTYATWWIRAFVMRSITTQSRSIKVPSTVVDEYSRIRREFERLREAGNFAPSDEEVARELGMTAAKMRFVMNAVTRMPSSLDMALDMKGEGGTPRPLAELIEGGDRVEERLVMEMERKELDKALRGCLRPLERAAIRLRFGLDDGQTRTLRETGVLLGLSKERIRQVIFRALPKLRTPEIQEMLMSVTTY